MFPRVVGKKIDQPYLVETTYIIFLKKNSLGHYFNHLTLSKNWGPNPVRVIISLIPWRFLGIVFVTKKRSIEKCFQDGILRCSSKWFCLAFNGFSSFFLLKIGDTLESDQTW